MAQRVLVTGANGFVGRVVCAELVRQGCAVRAAVRDPARAGALPGDVVRIGPSLGETDWSPLVADVDAVVHLAARVHVMQEKASDPLAAFRAVNVEGTRSIAQAAAAAGVRRLVFVSSVKVNGEATGARPFAPEDEPAPEDAYGLSKWEAERALHAVAAASGLEVAIVRPPLVYGAGVGGNFLRLLKLVRSGMPLPLGAVANRRSMIYNANLASALAACAFHPAAAGRTWLVSDGEDLSTPELVRRLAAHLGTRARLIAVPRGILDLAGTLTGKRAEVDRLVGSLRVDSSALRSALGWTPPFSVDAGLEETARWFRGTGAAGARAA